MNTSARWTDPACGIAAVEHNDVRVAHRGICGRAVAAAASMASGRAPILRRSARSSRTGDWSQEDARRWRAGLRFVALPFLAPALAGLRIPAGIAARPEVLQNLLAQAEQDPDLTSGEAGGPVRPAVERCVARLAQESTVADANGLQEWLELNFVCRDRPIAMYTPGGPSSTGLLPGPAVYTSGSRRRPR